MANAPPLRLTQPKQELRILKKCSILQGCVCSWMPFWRLDAHAGSGVQ